MLSAMIGRSRRAVLHAVCNCATVFCDMGAGNGFACRGDAGGNLACLNHAFTSEVEVAL